MAWPSDRLWRICRVGIGVGCTVYKRAMALYMRISMVCYGVCGYGVQALGVRMVYVVYVSCGVRMVYVVCTLCISIYDVT